MSTSKVTHDSETPAHGQQVISAVPFIHRAENGVHKIFLAKRAETKAFLPGVFEMTGGHVDFGESITEGLAREIREELGVEISIGDCFACFTYVNKVKGSHTIQVGFFATFKDEEPQITLHPEDHSESKWFSRQDLITHKNDIRPEAKTAEDSIDRHNDSDDDEFDMIMKGFDILEGKPLDLG